MVTKQPAECLRKSSNEMNNKKSEKKQSVSQNKLIIYQLFPRIFSNTNPTCKPWGTLEENGVGKLNDITTKVIRSIADLGVNCLWFTGIIEMATKTAFPGIPADNPNVVKGEAGSPYAIKDYYDVAPSLAVNVEKRMEEFEALVKRVHAEGLKMIIDFVPNHTARVYHSDVAPEGVKDFGDSDDISMFFSPSNNYYYIPNQQFTPCFDLGKEGDHPYVEFPAKATGNDCFSASCGRNDWYETVKLNYGFDSWDHSNHFHPIPDTWMKMRDILMFWASKGVDGFRCDMVFMVPQEFWNWVIPQIKSHYPDIIFIGEIYDVGLYRRFLDYCHFDYLYDKVNLYDTLVGIEKYNFSAARLTGCWQTVDGIGDRMLNFLENHDEVRFASDEYCKEPDLVIPSLVVSAFISKGPFMIYYGQELGEGAHENEGFAGYNNRTTIFDYWSVDTLRRWYNDGKCSLTRLTKQERWLRNLYKKVLNLANQCEAISKGNFFDLMYVNLRNPDFDPHRQFAFIRYTDKEALLIVANFDNTDKKIKINFPQLAIDMAGLKEGKYVSDDLLWEKNHTVNISEANPVELIVGGHDALVLPLKIKA